MYFWIIQKYIYSKSELVEYKTKNSHIIYKIWYVILEKFYIKINTQITYAEPYNTKALCPYLNTTRDAIS